MIRLDQSREPNRYRKRGMFLARPMGVKIPRKMIKRNSVNILFFTSGVRRWNKCFYKYSTDSWHRIESYHKIPLISAVLIDGFFYDNDYFTVLTVIYCFTNLILHGTRNLTWMKRLFWGLQVLTIGCIRKSWNVQEVYLVKVF